jgi:hydroxymethylglutaryl-CoA lyase
VLAAANMIDGLVPSVLVPNLKGGVRAMEHGARKITFVLSASEAHNMSNVRKPTDASLAEFAELVDERNRRAAAGTVEVAAIVSTAFGCSIQGEVPERCVLEIAAALLATGADELSIADTVGYANPVQVRSMFDALAGIAGTTPLAAHFHDTRAMGLANVVAALEAGVRRFDASLGGLGGCPFAPGATGNIATEDCVYMLETMGLATGIDIAGMLEVRHKLADWLPGERIEGRLLQAGPARTFSTGSD